MSERPLRQYQEDFLEQYSLQQLEDAKKILIDDYNRGVEAIPEFPQYSKPILDAKILLLDTAIAHKLSCIVELP